MHFMMNFSLQKKTKTIIVIYSFFEKFEYCFQNHTPVFVAILGNLKACLCWLISFWYLRWNSISSMCFACPWHLLKDFYGTKSKCIWKIKQAKKSADPFKSNLVCLCVRREGISASVKAVLKYAEKLVREYWFNFLPLFSAANYRAPDNCL